jgi:hypothetical protein
MEPRPHQHDESRDVTSTLATETEHLSETARTIKDEVQASAASLKEKVADLGEREKNYAAERIDQVAKAVHGAADELGSQIPGASRYIHDTAASLERASSTLQQSSVEEMLSTLNKFAREQPALFFGGAVVAGISLSRFLKSSGSSHRR